MDNEYNEYKVPESAKNHKDEIIMPIKYAREIIGENKVNKYLNGANESMQDSTYVGINLDKQKEMTFYLTNDRGRLTVSQKMKDNGEFACENVDEKLTNIDKLKVNELMTSKISEIELIEKSLQTNNKLDVEPKSKLSNNSNEMKNKQSKLNL